MRFELEQRAEGETLASDEALYESLLNGDLRSFDVLYERHRRHLFGFICKHVSDPIEAEDIFHEAFLTILKDRAAARAARSLRAWLFQVARNLCLNHHRARRRAAHALTQEVPLPSPSAPPDHAIDQRQVRAGLAQAIAKLPLEHAELFHLRSQGMSYEEMADVLTIPIGTVKSRMHQMVARLRQEMKT